MEVGDLTDWERRALRSAAEAVVDRRLELVERLISPAWRPEMSGADFFLEADDFGNYGRLDLRLPPGDLTDWEIEVYERRADYAEVPALAVDIALWSEQEGGRSDLTLQVDLLREAPGSPPRVFLRALHVL